MTATVCSDCGYRHASNDARAIGRFGDAPGYVAGHAGTPIRATRAEAERDECLWRQMRRLRAAPAAVSGTSRPAAKSVSDQEPFPATRMETLAREKEWVTFLSEALFSLEVEALDSVAPLSRGFAGATRNFGEMVA